MKLHKNDLKDALDVYDILVTTNEDAGDLGFNRMRGKDVERIQNLIANARRVYTATEGVLIIRRASDSASRRKQR